MGLLVGRSLKGKLEHGEHQLAKLHLELVKAKRRFSYLNETNFSRKIKETEQQITNEETRLERLLLARQERIKQWVKSMTRGSKKPVLFKEGEVPELTRKQSTILESEFGQIAIIERNVKRLRSLKRTLIKDRESKEKELEKLERKIARTTRKLLRIQEETTEVIGKISKRGWGWPNNRPRA